MTNDLAADDHVLNPAIDARALQGNHTDFGIPTGRDLLGRTVPFLEWQERLRSHRMHPFSRALNTPPGPEARVRSDDGVTTIGINFASQDYLSLASHHAVREAAVRALAEFGPHGAGSPCLSGNSRLSLALERAVGDLVQMEHVLLFPTGWAAGFGAISGLVRAQDHVVLDRFAHACLQHGAGAATRNVVHHAHLDAADARARLAAIRSRDAANGILVVTEGLFSMDSDNPDLPRLQEVCREYDATLLVNVAHDLGALGPHGTGVVGRQRMLGKVDLIMGSFSKTFASNGGFLATGSRSVKQYVGWFADSHARSSALSPIQAGIVLEALRIVPSEEGDELRMKLLDVVKTLRNTLVAGATTVLGSPSAIVPIPLGPEPRARHATTVMGDRGLLANLAEYPTVPLGGARVRLEAMAGHTRDQAIRAAEIVRDAVLEADRLLREARPADLAR